MNLLNKIKNKSIKIFHYLEKKIFAFIMIASAILIIYYTNFVKVVSTHSGIHKPTLYLSFSLYSICISIILYISIILPITKKYTDEEIDSKIDKYAPYISIIGVTAMILFCYSSWEVYGFYSPFILIFIKLGLFFTHHFIPNLETFGNLFFFILIIGILTSWYFIPHDGTFHSIVNKEDL